MCAVCKKPVDYMERWEDQINYVTYFRVYCHGKVQVTKLEIEDWLHMKELTPGVAFEDGKHD